MGNCCTKQSEQRIAQMRLERMRSPASRNPKIPSIEDMLHENS